MLIGIILSAVLNLARHIQLDVTVCMLLRLLVHQEFLPAQLVRVCLRLGFLLLLLTPLVNSGQKGSVLRQFLILQILLVGRVHTILLVVFARAIFLAVVRTVLMGLRLIMCDAWPGMIDTVFDDPV